VLRQPEAGFYLAGMKSYGRAPNFLMLTGYEQVRSIACALTGDADGARIVDLTLPATGVCNAPPVGATGSYAETYGIASACCGGPAPAAVEACCVLDAEAKAAGRDGCGCGSKEPATVEPTAACCGAPAPAVVATGLRIGHATRASEPASRPSCG
jgi:hypothetical protein